MSHSPEHSTPLALDLHDIEVGALDAARTGGTGLDTIAGGLAMVEVGASSAGPGVFLCSCCCCW